MKTCYLFDKNKEQWKERDNIWSGSDEKIRGIGGKLRGKEKSVKGGKEDNRAGGWILGDKLPMEIRKLESQKT